MSEALERIRAKWKGYGEIEHDVVLLAEALEELEETFHELGCMSIGCPACEAKRTLAQVSGVAVK
jgi:hypothetical protein